MINLNGKTLFIASGNKGKIVEITELFEALGAKTLSTNDINIDEPEEYGKTFAENALIKAKYYSEKTGYIAIADDSGLEVEALGGEPGIYSARLGELENGARDFTIAMQRLEKQINEKNIETRGDKANKNQLKANFTCSLALQTPEDISLICEGKVFGHLEFPMRGEKGFGYDPIFVAEGYEKTFAEIDPKEKHSISHRAKAFNKLKNLLNN